MLTKYVYIFYLDNILDLGNRLYDLGYTFLSFKKI